MAASLTLSLGLFSCKNEPKKAAEDAMQQTEGITFLFTMPGGDAHVVDTRALHDNPEWAIDELWMYVFDEKGEKLTQDPIDITKKPEFKYTGTDAKYTYKPKWEKDKQLQFFFVANMKIDLKAGATKAQLLAKVHDKQLQTQSADILYPAKSGNEMRIPMTAYATQGESRVIAISANATVEVKLKRTVARIDILNRIPGFKITKLELFNAFKNANVVEESTHAIADNRLKSFVAPFATLDGVNNVGKREGTTIKKAFYLYEGKNQGVADDDVTYVKITAEYGSVPARTFIIPFKAKDAAGNFTNVKDVKRNCLYKIVLGTKIDPVKGAEVTFSIEEEPWNAIDLEENAEPIHVQRTDVGDLVDRSYMQGTYLVRKNTSGILSLSNDFQVDGNYSATTDSPDWLTDFRFANGATKYESGNSDDFVFKVGDVPVGKEGKIMLKFSASDEVFTVKVKVR